nr:unnamed protein product [Spirometra erinaceieuropaei]
MPTVFSPTSSCIITMDTELQSLKGTLAEVDQLLELSQDNSADLLSLKKDLAHLIELKEADLLERSKQTALAAVASALGSLSVPEPENDATPSSQAVDPSTVSPPEEELVGTKCSLPGWTSRGYFVHRNAVIAELLNEGSLTSRRVRLFFTNPTRLIDLGGVARPSLDRLVQLRRGKRPVRNRRHRQRCRDSGTATAAGGFRQAARLLAPSPTVFDYLNNNVLAASSSTHLPAPKTPTICGKSRKQLNIEHYNIQREITLVESEIARAEESLKRNQSRDRLAAASASQRLQSLRAKLASLKNHERALSRETAKQKNKEKLCVF